MLELCDPRAPVVFLWDRYGFLKLIWLIVEKYFAFGSEQELLATIIIDRVVIISFGPGILLPLLFFDKCGRLAIDQVVKEKAFRAPVEAVLDFLLCLVLVHFSKYSWLDELSK